jgi:hypothetical protein
LSMLYQHHYVTNWNACITILRVCDVKMAHERPHCIHIFYEDNLTLCPRRRLREV